MTSRDDWNSEQHYKECVKPKLQPQDFYWEGGVMVMTEEYHKRRGSCCGSGCRHCPYSPSHVKLNNNLREYSKNQRSTN